MQAKLKEIALVQAGYSFRSRLEPARGGNLAVIQMKDLTDSNIVNVASLTRIEMDDVSDKHLVRPGDLIFRSRGFVFTAAILIADAGNAVVTAPLLRIRPANAIMPEYLNWYINQQPSQKYLLSCAKGTSLKMISKQAIECLTVDVPSIARQKAIIELADMLTREQQLAGELADKRAKYVGKILMQVASEAQ